MWISGVAFVRRDFVGSKREMSPNRARQISFPKGLEFRMAHSIRIQGDHNNNKMERLNGEIRDREKVMRGLKKPDTPIIPGYQIYHNYVRPHEALEGKTPADACGIEVQGENKWLTLIQNASNNHR